MKLKTLRIELDKYDDDYELVMGNTTEFNFVASDDDKTVSHSTQLILSPLKNKCNYLSL
jgi:hypothetical protein